MEKGGRVSRIDRIVVLADEILKRLEFEMWDEDASTDRVADLAVTLNSLLSAADGAHSVQQLAGVDEMVSP